MLSCLDQLASLSTGPERGRQGVSRGEFSTRVLGGPWSISRAWSCHDEARLGEDEVPDDPHVLRTRCSVKTLVWEASRSDEIAVLVLVPSERA